MLSAAAERDLKVSLLDAAFALGCEAMRCNVYIELPYQDPRLGNGRTIGRLMKAMYGTQGAPRIWADTVKGDGWLGPQSQPVAPFGVLAQGRGMMEVVHVVDFLCMGWSDELFWLFVSVWKSTT